MLHYVYRGGGVYSIFYDDSAHKADILLSFVGWIELVSVQLDVERYWNYWVVPQKCQPEIGNFQGEPITYRGVEVW